MWLAMFQACTPQKPCLKPLYIPIQFTAHTYLSWSTIGSNYIKLKSELQYSIAVICIWYSSSFCLYLYMYTVKYSCLTVLVKLLCLRKEYVFSETMIHTWILLFLYTHCLNYFSDTDSHSSREEDRIAECIRNCVCLECLPWVSTPVLSGST